MFDEENDLEELEELQDSSNSSKENNDDEIQPLELMNSGEYDFISEAKKRFDGVNKDSYLECLSLCQEIYETLPSYDKKSIDEEIYSWDFSVPDSMNTDYEAIAESYSRLIAYRLRISALIDLVTQRHEFLSERSEEHTSELQSH